MSICKGISSATDVYETFKQNIYEDKTRLCFINCVLFMHTFAFSQCTIYVQAFVVLNKKTQHSQPSSLFICQEKIVFSLFASSPLSDSVTLCSFVFIFATTVKLSFKFASSD